MSAFEDFVNLELPRRSTLLTFANTSYDGDPNDGGAPAVVANAPLGTWFREETAGKWWRKTSSAPGSYEEQNAGEGGLGPVGRVLITWYVRPGGDDDNDGTTPGTAFATLQRALRELKDDEEGLAMQRIDVTGMSITGADTFYWNWPKGGDRYEFDFLRDTTNAKQNYFDVPFELYAEPTFVRDITITGSTLDPITGIADITVSDTLVADELVGKIIWIGLFQNATVVSNTANNIKVGTYLTTAFPNGTFGVYEQSCTIDVGDPAKSYFGLQWTLNGLTVFNGIKFENAVSACPVSSRFQANNRSVFLWCYLDGTDFSAVGREFYMFDTFMPQNDFYINAPIGIQGCGFRDTSLRFIGASGAGATGMSYNFFDGCRALGGGNFEQSTDIVISNNEIWNSTEQGIRVESPFQGRINNNRIENANSDGILIACGGGSIKIRNNTGAGNGGYGCRLVRGAHVSYQHTIGPNTVTGASGEVKVGGLDVRLWSDMPAHDFDEADPEGCVVGGGPDETHPRFSRQWMYEPNSGKSGPYVFDDFDDLYAAIENARRIDNEGDSTFYRLLFSDRSLAAPFDPIVIPASATVYNMKGVRWNGGGSSGGANVHIADGCHFENLRWFERGIFLRNLNTTTPCDDSLGSLSGDDEDTVRVGGECDISGNSGGAPLYGKGNMQAGDFIGLRCFNRGQLGNNSDGPIFDILAGCFFIMEFGFGSQIEPVRNDVVRGEVGATLLAVYGSFFEQNLPIDSWLGTVFDIRTDAPAGLGIEPLPGLPASPTVTTKHGRMHRIDSRSGVVGQVLPTINGTVVPNPGGLLSIVDSEGGQGIDVTPASGDTLAGALRATGTLTLAANPADTETVVIEGKTYTFQAVLTDVDGNVLIGASASDSLDNLIAAINLGAGSGSLYAASTTANSDVSAAAGLGDTMVATALARGTAGNSIDTTETLAAGGSEWANATLLGGTNGSVSIPRNGGAVFQSDGINHWQLVGFYDPSEGGAYDMLTWSPANGGNGPISHSTFETLYAQMELVRAASGGDGFKEFRVFVDAPLDQPVDYVTEALIPPGGPYDLSGVIFDSARRGNICWIDIADGATITGLRRIGDYIAIRNLNTTVPADSSLAANDFISIGFNSYANSAPGATPLWSGANLLGGDFVLLVMEDFGTLNFNAFGGAAGAPVLDMPVSGTFVALGGAGASDMPDDAVSGDAGAVLVIVTGNMKSIPAVHTGWLGSVVHQAIREPASVKPIPTFLATATAAAGTLTPGEWHRYDVSGGPVVVSLFDSQNSSNKPFAGVQTFISEESNTSGLSVSPAAGETINGVAADYDVPAGSMVMLMNDGLGAWTASVVYDPNLAPPNEVVYTPGGTDSGPVLYSDWATMMGRIDELRSLYTIPRIKLWFDPRITNPITLPVGTWDMTDVEWNCGLEFATVRIPEGCILQKMRYFRGNMRIENRATATSPCTDLVDSDSIELYDGAAINQFGTVPMYDMQSLGNGDFLGILCQFIGGIGVYNPNPAGGPLINMPNAGSQINMNLWTGGTLTGGNLGGVVGTLLLGLIASDTARFDPLQPAFLGTLNQFAFDRTSHLPSAALLTTTTNLNDGDLARFDTTAANVVGNLPAANSVFRGRELVVKNEAGANNVNVTPNGADTIDGVAALYAVAAGDAARFVTDGISNWTRI